MGISKIFSAILSGLNPILITVEADINKRKVVRDIDIVGLGDTAVKESKKRVISAIRNSGIPVPQGYITVNLAPADLKKEGSLLDLSVALSILGLEIDFLKEKVIALGELSLDGKIRKVRGILPIMSGFSDDFLFVVPKDNEKEARLSGKKFYPVDNLYEVYNFLTSDMELDYNLYKIDEFKDFSETFKEDFSDVKGHAIVKRAMEIVAAGGHNLLMVGPPGSGKTMLARRLPTILPPLSIDETLEVTKIYSAAGLLENTIVSKRPFRSPHHTASAVSIIGGGVRPKPGEITLAHKGVLFLDEFPEFRRDVLEALRQPLEEGVAHITRSQFSITYPAEFILVAAMNPCPCGYYGDKEIQCKCNAYEIERYRKKVSGPILDRIDVQIDVPRLKYEEIRNYVPGESSKEIKKRVIKAREIQRKRYESPLLNSRMSHKMIEKFVKLDDKSEELLKMFVKRYKLSGRAIDKVLKVSRTIADLSESENVKFSHLSEALQYRLHNN
ncbi:YifB family Mg chelatase-like AAA ATPase [Thermosipho ferrireducens]|uniref:YifB family Mg chelatase-like AAA ATPase n=1 Tax=Thermosipho ferrireducens TaxID=2571116 RepID=A0ABX7S5M0_9BACT|nr:YifB family Mg chelatase-like AAA ATPase [Thermosipho ferrireducens]QTA37454.1 YifB family Mg chelatase-like AAA ATPase [Thermosipho ferrireducens]